MTGEVCCFVGKEVVAGRIGLFLPITDRVWRTLDSWEWSAILRAFVVMERAPLIISIPTMQVVDY